MFERIIKIPKSHSFFLFGPRSTGKTTLLQQHFPESEALWVNLLSPRTERLLRRDPDALESLIEARSTVQFVVIDEVQKNPPLLDVVHRLMVEKKIKFVLTGSSARKLLRGGANLLAGRAFRFECFPLTHVELRERFRLEEVLSYGALPEVFSLSEDGKRSFLRAYVDTYFREEVVAEQLVRNLIPFRDFLEIASQSNGKILNMNNIAKAVAVDHTTVQNYFSILEDTMIGFLLPPYHQSIRQRQRSKSKFYYFDLGVQRALAGLLEFGVMEGSLDFGNAFEHFIVSEFHRLIRYRKPDWKMFYLRTSDEAEIDLIIERPRQKIVLLEIKSTNNVDSLDQQKLLGFRKLSADFKNAETFLVSRDPRHVKEAHVEHLPWQKIFARIGLEEPPQIR